jgi:hypothetical protein
MHPSRRLPVADSSGRLISYTAAELARAGPARLLEAVGDVDSDGLDDLGIGGPGNGNGNGRNGNGGGNGDDEHRSHLADAARAIFANKALSAEAKLKKLRLLLKIDDAGEPEDDSDTEQGDDLPDEINSSEGWLRKAYRQLRRRPPDTTPNFLALNPGAVAFPGLMAIAEANGQLPRGSATRLREASRRRGGRLTQAKFLAVLREGR